MLRWTTRIRTRWLIVACVAVGLVLLYVTFLLGTAVDGVINVDARVHSTVLTAFSITVVTSAVLAGVAHMMIRRDRALVAEFAAAKKQRAYIAEKLDRIQGGQSLAVALKVPAGEFQRVNGTSPDVRPEAPQADDELDDYAKGVVDGLARRPGRADGVIGLRTPRT